MTAERQRPWLFVVPCFNEAKRWDQRYWDAMAELDDIDWVFVDDGSTDSTAHLLARMAERPNVSVLTMRANAGKAEAVRAGMRWGVEDGRWDGVAFMDADGAFDHADVRRLVDEYPWAANGDAVDALWSSRVALAGRAISRSQSRHYLGRVIATFISAAEPEYPYDTQSGLKLFACTADLDHCLRAPFQTRWLFEIELLVRWRALNGRSMRIWEEPLGKWHDVEGSSITARESVRIARELLVVNRMQRRASKTVTQHRLTPQ